MKKSILYLFICSLLFSIIIIACNSKPKEPEITEMKISQDSLKETDKKVSDNIEKTQKSMKDLDDKFETKN